MVEAAFMRIVLLGPPGAGKGTQASRIAERFKLPHVATGEIFRANVADGTALGQVAQEYLDSGELVPDEIVIAMVLERLAEPDCAKGFVLDGFPRSGPQARALDKQLVELGTPLDAVINLEVTEQDLIRRLSGRGRDDDNEQTVRNRLAVFNRTTAPLLDYYIEHGLLYNIPAEGPIDEVTEIILSAPANAALLATGQRVTPEGVVTTVRIVLLGPPGAGKGTQAARIAERYRVPNIATGEIFKVNVAQETTLGLIALEYLDSGELVPDDVVIAMVLERLAEPDCAGGFVLDGFPRTGTQARALDKRLGELGMPLDAVINLELTEDELRRRLSESGRGVGNPAVVQTRMEIFTRTTEPLLDYYEERGMLFNVPADGEVDDVTDRILSATLEVTHRPHGNLWAGLIANGSRTRSAGAAAQADGPEEERAGAG
jgi:adenylate kinase